ncbi:MAG: HAD hydrolase-like protein [Thermoplasmata archaeon]
MKPRARKPSHSSSPPPEPAPPDAPLEGLELPIVSSAASQFSEISRLPTLPREVVPTHVERGVVVFDMDGTILDDISLISHVAADVMHTAFGTPIEEGRIHYLATTGMPFEAQLSQLYGNAPATLRAATARTFHGRKVTEAYAHAGPFPEVPKLLKRLSQEHWTLVISTGAETEMADLLLEREGLRFWFEDVLGSAQGTKREHLQEYRRRYPGARIFLIGDSRFDMEAAASVEGVTPIGRASSLHGWGLTPEDLRSWGAAWADYSLSALPEKLAELERGPSKASNRKKSSRRGAKKPGRRR